MRLWVIAGGGLLSISAQDQAERQGHYSDHDLDLVIEGPSERTRQPTIGVAE